ncbi:hypothetical protein PSHT_07152 [Puccinia striiformis]|uniref:Uncharacterized protein n=1 Tax=Puccinia striiformis TaxID=27350 RepID=A0A2S4W0G7_9BASI|nr:hypothetical protein PSHT_07152 [Puccinia striiformis]
MSLLENRLKDVHHHHHHHRPILKRSRTPYQTPEDSKRRRTSPTGAFSKLSLSPTTTSSTHNDHQSLTPTTTWLTHYSNQQLNSTGYHSVYEPITIESLSDNKTDSPSHHQNSTDHRSNLVSPLSSDDDDDGPQIVEIDENDQHILSHPTQKII